MPSFLALAVRDGSFAIAYVEVVAKGVSARVGFYSALKAAWEAFAGLAAFFAFAFGLAFGFALAFLLGLAFALGFARPFAFSGLGFGFPSPGSAAF